MGETQCSITTEWKKVRSKKLLAAAVELNGSMSKWFGRIVEASLDNSISFLMLLTDILIMMFKL